MLDYTENLLHTTDPAFAIDGLTQVPGSPGVLLTNLNSMDPLVASIHLYRPWALVRGRTPAGEAYALLALALHDPSRITIDAADPANAAAKAYRIAVAAVQGPINASVCICVRPAASPPEWCLQLPPAYCTVVVASRVDRATVPLGRVTPPPTVQTAVNGTERHVVVIPNDPDVVIVDIDTAGTVSVEGVSVVRYNVSSALADAAAVGPAEVAAVRADMARLQVTLSETQAAMATVFTYSRVPMEHGLEPAVQSVPAWARMCWVRTRAAPCGVLATDAMARGFPNTDIQAFNGGALRTGWPAGPLSPAALRALVPFSSQACLVSLRGVHVWALLNFSVAGAQPNGTYLTSAPHGRYLQLRGVNLTFDGRLPQYPTRITSPILVQNRITGVPEPLNRARVYDLALPDYMCTGGDDYGPYVDIALSKQLVQTSVAGLIREYIDERGEVSASMLALRGDVVRTDLGTATPVPQRVFASSDACDAGQRYDAAALDCLDCPAGFIGSFDRTTCVVAPQRGGDAGTSSAVIGGCVGAAVLVVVAAGSAVAWAMLRSRQDNKNAPKDAERPIAVAFTDIQASTTLWGTEPEAMGVALEAHHAIMRRCVQRWRGYEVKTIGDSFMVAFSDPADAVRFALEVQERLLEHPWGTTAFDDVYAELLEDTTASSPNASADTAASLPPATATILPSPQPICGLRVRVGLHYGPAAVVLDDTTKRYDYYGPTVNAAARVEGAGHGGQVIVTSALWVALPADVAAEVAALPLGTFTLRGVADPMELVQVSSRRLAGRRFPPPKTEGGGEDEVDKVGAAEDAPSDRASQISSARGADAPAFPVGQVLATLFSTLRGPERLKHVETLAGRWGLNAHVGGAKRVEVLTAMLVSKVALVLRATHRLTGFASARSMALHEGRGNPASIRYRKRQSVAVAPESSSGTALAVLQRHVSASAVTSVTDLFPSNP